MGSVSSEHVMTEPIITEQQNYSIAGCGELKARRRFGRNLAALFANLAYHILVSNSLLTSNSLCVGRRLQISIELTNDAQNYCITAKVYADQHGPDDN